MVGDKRLRTRFADADRLRVGENRASTRKSFVRLRAGARFAAKVGMPVETVRANIASWPRGISSTILEYNSCVFAFLFQSFDYVTLLKLYALFLSFEKLKRLIIYIRFASLKLR